MTRTTRVPAFCCLLWGFLPGCTTPASATKFTGTEHAVIARPDQVEQLAGDKPPDGYQVIGVVTARCATINGASGLLEGPCSRPAMTQEAKTRAAQAGGSALLDVKCVEDMTDRMLERRDGGGAEAIIRTQVICQATVLRGAVVPRARAVAPSSGGRRRITISGAEVDVTSENTPAAAPRDPEQVGVIEQAPPGYPRLGTVHARCVAGCARSIARRGLQHAAALLGAAAVAEVTCSMAGERWSCSGTAIGDEPIADGLDGGPGDAVAEPIADAATD